MFRRSVSEEVNISEGGFRGGQAGGSPEGGNVSYRGGGRGGQTGGSPEGGGVSYIGGAGGGEGGEGGVGRQVKSNDPNTGGWGNIRTEMNTKNNRGQGTMFLPLLGHLMSEV